MQQKLTEENFFGPYNKRWMRSNPSHTLSSEPTFSARNNFRSSYDADSVAGTAVQDTRTTINSVANWKLGVKTSLLTLERIYTHPCLIGEIATAPPRLTSLHALQIFN